jgi:DNA mismatch endonuclease (patch repair protein)
MSLIKSEWTKPERLLHGFLKARKIRHKMHPAIEGRPDILIYPKTVAFVDGCFWHGCKIHKTKTPSTRAEFWSQKIRKNVARDKKTTVYLKRHGWKVIRIWEHDTTKQNVGDVIRRLARG